MKTLAQVLLVVVLGSFLVACPNGSVTPPNTSPYLGMNPTITGTVAGYAGGAGKITISSAPFFQDAGTIATNGAFSITLPSSGFPLSTFVINCIAGTGSVSMTPSNAKAAFVDASTPNTFLTQSESPNSNTVGTVWRSYLRWFSDKDVVITGTCTTLRNTATNAKGTETYNLSLKAGWNEISIKNTVNNTGSSDNEYTLGIPSNQPWLNNSIGKF